MGTIKLDYINRNTSFEIEKQANHSLFFDQSLNCKVYNNAIAVPSRENQSGFVVKEDGVIVKESLIEESYAQVFCPQNENTLKKDNRIAILFCNFISYCFGHIITDGLRKLWFF